MAFNLGAFAGGLASGGLKTYQTLTEMERQKAIEERDKVRFEEEQRRIDQQREAEEISRKAAIPTAAAVPGAKLNDVVAALPIGGSEASPGDLTKTTDAYQQKFKDVFGGLTPEQQALVLRQYGDTSTPGGGALQRTQAAAGAPEALAGLNAAVVREDAGGGRSVVNADTDEKAIVTRYKQMAMASGNPLAIKAAHEAEAGMLNRQVAQQQIAIGEQNIDLNKYKIAGAKNEQDFKDKWTAEMTAAKKDHFDLMKQIDTSLTKNPTLQGLVDEYGPKLKDVTGQTFSVKDGKVVTTGADGNTTVVASDVAQAGNLLKQAATNNFAQDFQDRILAKGLFEKPADLAAFIKDKQDFFIKTGTLATQQVAAAAATKNAESAATTATANKAKIDAELKANIPQAQAALLQAQASSASSMANYHSGLLKMANDKNALDVEARTAMKAALADFDKLTPEEQIGPKGAAMVAQAAAIAARKTGDLNGLLTSIAREQKAEAIRPTTPADVAKFVETFGASPSSFKDGNGNPIPIGQLSPAQAMQEMQGMMGGKGAAGTGLDGKTPPPPAPPGGKTSADTAAKPAAIPYTPPPGSPAAIELAKRQAEADAKKQAAQTLVNNATAAATAAISAGSQADARKVQQMDGFSSLPVAVQAQISKIVNRPATAIPAAKAPAPAAPAPAAPTGKSVAAQEEDLSYAAIVAQSNYDRRPGATTKAQLDNAQQALAAFRKANGIKP